MKYVFGPVFSRRLGLSLGVDLVPYKVCSMDCLYCEVGKTTIKTIERKEYVPLEEVVKELESYLSYNPELDFITFSGYGEPTLFSRLGELVNFLKEKYNYKLALLTNASLLHKDEVLKDIEKIDLVLPSLDAVSKSVFEKLNKPFKSLSSELVVEGIKKLSLLGNKIWVETLFARGVNDSEEEIEKIGKVIHEVKPDKWQLNTVARPPAYNVLPLTLDELEKIKEKVGYPKTEIVVYRSCKEGKSQSKDLKEKIYDIVVRRPCPIDEIASALGVSEEKILEEVEKLELEGKVDKVFFGSILYVKGKR
jgi:wyosine [tRNA(Phe)-imidazoG37] synthetase (radical SAM superfamily)